MIKNLRSLFRRKNISQEDIKTAPLSDEQLLTVSSPPLKLEPPQLVVGTGQSVGKQREHNEDCLYALNLVLSGNGSGLALGIFIVADGMGGYQHGEVASVAATRALSNHMLQKLILPQFGIRPEPLSEPLQEILKQGMKEAQQAVLKMAPGGGTTLTAAFVVGDQVTLAHVGDSRAYFIFPDGRIQAITRDHSLVKRLQELGQISELEAASHPQRNVLYRAIGQGEPYEADIETYQMPHPGYLMLCSDGLWGVIPDSEILHIIQRALNPTLACQELVKRANEHGGPDNISVVLVQYPN